MLPEIFQWLPTKDFLDYKDRIRENLWPVKCLSNLSTIMSKTRKTNGEKNIETARRRKKYIENKHWYDFEFPAVNISKVWIQNILKKFLEMPQLFWWLVKNDPLMSFYLKNVLQILRQSLYKKQYLFFKFFDIYKSIYRRKPLSKLRKYHN